MEEVKQPDIDDRGEAPRRVIDAIEYLEDMRACFELIDQLCGLNLQETVMYTFQSLIRGAMDWPTDLLNDAIECLEEAYPEGGAS